MFKSILVPVDVVHQSSWEFAIPEALEIAKSSAGKVAIMTVAPIFKLLLDGVAVPFEMEQMIADARSKLANITYQYRQTHPNIEQEVRFGRIGHEILSACKERDVDLIVMASHRPEMLDYLIGPNAAYVARHATCSVLVLRKFAKDAVLSGDSLA